METKIGNPRLVLKATAPRASPSLVFRPRLGLHQGNQADSSIISVHAAAGYGKSSLLLQWRREALESGAIVAWLTLDEHDDHSNFASGLGAALAIGSGSGKFVYEPNVGQHPGSDEKEALTVWLAEIAGMAVDVVLILDDAHALPKAVARDSLMYLLLNIPANLKIILASRRALPINFADLIATGRLLELGSDEMALTMGETSEILREKLGATLDQDSCVRLHELTEGWPLGVQLALSNVLKSSNLREAIAEFSARSGDLQHYFIQCLVDRLTEPTAMFLTEIACLQRIHPDLCSVMTGNGETEELLEQLRNETPIFRDESDSDWMRIHPIAREFLLERFERLPKRHRKGLHANAAHWLADHDMYEEAAEHALAAGHTDFAYDLVERCLYQILVEGRVSRVMAWWARLPAEVIERRPQIRIAVGWALALGERQAEAAELVAPVLEDEEMALSDRYEAAALCATAAFFTDDMDRMRAIYQPWHTRLTQPSAFQRIAAANLSAAIELFHAKPQNAHYHLEQLHDIPWSPELGYALGWAGWLSGFAYLWEGQVILAEEVLRVALTHSEEISGRRSPIAVMLAATLAAVLWERDSLDEAEILLADRLDVLESHSPPDAIIHGYVTAARLAAARGKHSKAHDLIEHLRAIGDERQLPRVCVMSLAEKIRMLAFRHQEAACRARVQRLVELDESLDSTWGELQPIIETQFGLARAYTAISGHRWDLAIEPLEAIEPLAARFRLVPEAIKIQFLLATARQKSGADARADIAGAASLSETLGLTRLAADTLPDGFDQVIASAAPVVTETSQSETKKDLAKKGLALKVVETSLLTPKETEVLQLLAANLTNKQIASAMGVGDQTVKWHLKNMFTKLQAGSRKHLLGRARMLGILE